MRRLKRTSKKCRACGKVKEHRDDGLPALSCVGCGGGFVYDVELLDLGSHLGCAEREMAVPMAQLTREDE